MTQNATEADFDAIDAENTKLLADIREASEVVYEDDDVVVFYDHEYIGIDEIVSEYGVDRIELLRHMRELAPDEVDTELYSGAPFVVKKPQDD